jgi:hypothetical protein
MVDEFKTEGYQRHNRARQEHLASLGLDLQGKTVLELGAGVGDHTGFWLDRGCEVACVEARDENAKRIRERYPQVEVRCYDLDNLADATWCDWQIVYAYGVLYHLGRPAEALAAWALRCQELLLLETVVDPGPLCELKKLQESADNPTASFSGLACRPTRNWVYQELSKHFAHVYLPVTQPDHPEFPLDWSAMPWGEDDFGEEMRGLIRAVFIASRTPLQNPLLVEQLPVRYLACRKMPQRNGT